MPIRLERLPPGVRQVARAGHQVGPTLAPHDAALLEAEAPPAPQLPQVIDSWDRLSHCGFESRRPHMTQARLKSTQGPRIGNTRQEQPAPTTGPTPERLARQGSSKKAVEKALKKPPTPPKKKPRDK